eukprot:2282541-Rhodomonas_salina.2
MLVSDILNGDAASNSLSVHASTALRSGFLSVYARSSADRTYRARSEQQHPARPSPLGSKHAKPVAAQRPCSKCPGRDGQSRF